ncbi:pirin family protein [Nonomuraea gerenzanensis]|uniref:Pirin n=1 Tax=Nonomuraea gerenzanensis TaxID=93944 RepID=A0A1M4E914_9ACTN|nr:pirin family protein [Nonomuraea gerenzanensis]UBU17629.1 pirin family protein [Nonomuraea gerenzanensis]SBO95397.1 Pirin [Nonomuraea gerenzanensis]
MSNLELDPLEIRCGADEGADNSAGREVLEGRDVPLGGPRAMAVSRTLPGVHRRMIGAWCFVDAYGPQRATMRVPPHPHTGLQTVSWLVAGEVLHRDSLGTLQEIRPGQLNLMTAGRGISHSEESPETVLHGVQLWVALPEGARQVEPGFEHHPTLPVLAGRGFSATVVMGTLGGVTSPATAHTPLVGAEVAVDGECVVPVDPAFEHGLLLLDGEVAELARGPLVYLPPGRPGVRLSGRGRVLLIGGEPFGEEIVMWWNFVGRDHDEIAAFRKEWMGGEGFGVVEGFDGAPLPAPVLPGTRLKPRGRVR